MVSMKDMENWFNQMELFTKVFLVMVRKMEKDFSKLNNILILVNSGKIKKMEKASSRIMLKIINTMEGSKIT